MIRSRLRRWCRPDIVVASVQEIDPEALRARGIRALLLDLDNTLVMWRSCDLRAEVSAWVERARGAGLRLCIVSNSSSARRVEPVAQQLGIPYTARAAKPSRRAFRRAAALLGVEPSQAAVVGDQLFTDVLGGNRAGMLTVLVNPINRNREFISTRIMRLVERLVWGGIHADHVALAGAAEREPNGAGRSPDTW